MTIAILIADEHPIVRYGLRILLEADACHQIVGEAGNGTEFFRLLQAHQPRVVIFEPMMAGLQGVRSLSRVAQIAPNTRTVLLSVTGEEAFVKQAWRLGVNSYLLKGATPAMIQEAVAEAAAGRRYLGPPLSAWASDAHQDAGDGNQADGPESLTPRELQVLTLVAEGQTSVQIAEHLSISPRTAEMHRANLMRKLGLKNQTALVRYALQQGLLPNE